MEFIIALGVVFNGCWYFIQLETRPSKPGCDPPTSISRVISGIVDHFADLCFSKDVKKNHTNY